MGAVPVSAEEGTDYQVDATSLNVRSTPSLDSPIIGSLEDGSTVTVLEEDGSWSRIDYNGYTGWISSDFLTASETPLEGVRITLDAGHGGTDPGAIGAAGTYEKDVNLSTAQRTYDELSDAGATVNMTRSGDQYVDLDERVNISHSYDSDAFISLHYNASTYSSAEGISSYYSDSSKDLLWARSMQDQLASKTDRLNNGVFQEEYRVVKDNQAPAVLVELGFLSNPEEEEVVQTESYQSLVADAITQGAIDYFDN
ncbi:N-acetylmuramoyl-L-alanine amidase [Halobacillus sp. A5]|uniref:N-acetylmuramoyl-L-alanine amidase n=1 Tax=Halobacillus sp. A5 TaxID=2880263 RepID=UPI0020A66DF3|nr:N-acetylmuramoyl-L-alanine amidase [Halobacillus sp. A5]MCP3028409.1 N-acetylmuramoyl-L-alanine amidase [Halobacillus sp. A5]